ncbi:MAG: hypothetical protein GY753_15985 [Gammaproteobacteria bacterium]|nr:hypothetical protein [Gammaproteobacteria bacterium]
MKKCSLLLCVLCIIFAGNAHATTTTFVLDQADATTGALLSGTTPINTTTANSSIGNGAWQANGTAKSTYYFDISSLGSNIKVSDLTEMGFSTYKTTTGGTAPDWYFTIYTKPDGVDDSSGWYGRRLTAEGLYANNLNNPANTWNTWSTDNGINELTFLDSNTTNSGFYGGPTLTDIQAGDLNWGSYPTSDSSATVNYADEVILGIAIETGSGWANGFTGLLDNVIIETSDDRLIFDLEVSASPVPIPAAVWLFGSGLLGLIGFSKRKKVA